MNRGGGTDASPVVEAKTASETVVASDENGNGSGAGRGGSRPQDASRPREKDRASDWQTDKKSDCQVEITAIRRAGDKEYAPRCTRSGLSFRRMSLTTASRST